MDELDEVILAVLIDGKPRSFQQLLEKVDLSHNTLRLHLNNLMDQALVTREKIT
jgi:DNA-binding HxlR family transcriptional regulator